MYKTCPADLSMDFEAKEAGWSMQFETNSCLMPREYFDPEVNFLECITIYMRFDQNFTGSAMVRLEFPFEQWFFRFPMEENLQES